MARVRVQQPDDVLQQHALAGAAAAQHDGGLARRKLQRDIIEDAQGAKRLRDVFEPDARGAGGASGHPVVSGKRKKMRRTSTTLAVISRIDAVTTLRVAE